MDYEKVASNQWPQCQKRIWLTPREQSRCIHACRLHTPDSLISHEPWPIRSFGLFVLSIIKWRSMSLLRTVSHNHCYSASFYSKQVHRWSLPWRLWCFATPKTWRQSSEDTMQNRFQTERSKKTQCMGFDFVEAIVLVVHVFWLLPSQLLQSYSRDFKNLMWFFFPWETSLSP